MNVKAWQILCFLAVILGATFAVFPTRRSLLPILFDSGRFKQARIVIDPLLKDAADDSELIGMSVRLHLIEGSPHLAIEQLRQLNRVLPLHADQLVELARLYEWTRKPQDARKAWEAALEKAPGNELIMARLIGYYRYAGETEKKAALIVRLVRQQRSAPVEPENNPLAERIADELEMKGREVVAALSPEPLEAMLISGLYQIYSQIVDTDAAAVKPDDPKTTHYTLRCLEQFVWAGFQQRGEAFAQELDELWDSGIDRQMLLVDVLRWSDMNREALDLLERIYQRVPAREDVLTAMAATAIAAEDPAAAIDAYPLLKHSLLTTEPGVEAFSELIQVAEYTENSALVADALEIAETRFPTDPDVLMQVAEGWLSAGRPEKAYASMRRLTALRGDRADDMERTLEMAEHTGDAHTIQSAVEWALEIDPDDTDLIDRAVDMYLAAGRPDRAYLLKADMVQRHRRVDEVPALIRLAEATGQSKLLEDALGKGLMLRPGDAEIQRRLAVFYLSQGSEKQSIAVFEKYLRRNPGDRAAQVQLAQLYEWQRQPRKALDVYRQLAERYPDDPDLSAAVDRLTRSSGDREAILNLLIAQAAGHPEDAGKALSAGMELVAENRLEQSLVYLERAARLDPQRTATWRTLADVYAWTGKSDALILALEKLVASGDLDPQQRVLLADAYLNRQRAGDALPLLKDIEKRSKMPPREGLMLLEAYERTHRQAAALRISRRLMNENRDNADFLAELGDRALWREHTSLALKAYEAALKMEPKNRGALKGSGQIHAWNNHHQRAIDILEVYNRLYPMDYEAQYLLGELYFATHRQGAAHRQYRKAMKLIHQTRHPRQKAGDTQPAIQVSQ
ncbi:MAG: hypothetical protein CSA23_05245 [Deltaproteobacteria bacterium]|nr:MAG: hypothetical protein CSA23_05245 [Deltaproteobacteria bacterium]